MNDVLVVMILRMVERIFAVGIGGFTIYLGYRLFVLLPMQTSGEGKIELPGYSVVLSKVGPGVFFAGFGAIVLFLSFTNSISIDDNNIVGASPSQPVSMMPPPEATPEAGERVISPQELARLRSDLQILNCVQEILAQTDEAPPVEDFERSIRDAKLALMQSAWMANLWGPESSFLRWASWNEGEPNAEAGALYLEVMPGCATVADPAGGG